MGDTTKNGNEIKLTFLGDLMCKQQMVAAFAKQGENRKAVFDFHPLYEEVIPFLGASDYVFANLETPVSFNNSNLCKKRFSFCAPPEFARAAKESGIDYVAAANNHSFDRGTEGIRSTVESLEQTGLRYSGIHTHPDEAPCIIDVSGIRIGVLSYTCGINASGMKDYLPRKESWRIDSFRKPYSCIFLKAKDHHCDGMIKIYRIWYQIRDRLFSHGTGTTFHERRKLVQEIEKCRKEKVDLIVAYMHAGGQYSNEALKGTKKLCAFLLQHGVNIVAGTHEHVVHGGDFSGFEEQKIGTYSLGNFCGIAGVYDVPHDKMAEYSVAWHVYIDRKHRKMTRTGFSVLKCIQPDPCSFKIQVFPVYHLQNILNQSDRMKLKHDTLKIAKAFSGIEFQEIEEEFVLR